jgi:hypothetical protein
VIPLQRLHQIEMTSHCNLKCVYCASPKLKRPKMHMKWEVFQRAIGWVRWFMEQHGQSEVNLAGIGESTMHPQFIDLLKYARMELGPDIDIVLATNGKLMTDALAQAMKPWNPTVFVSLHQPVLAGPAVECLKRAGLLAGVSNDPSIAATNWAGQVKWHNSAAPNRKCPWVVQGKTMVMADGRLTTCSLDASGVGVIGHINDDLTKIQTKPYSLCRTCDQDVGFPIPDEPNVFVDAKRVIHDSVNSSKMQTIPVEATA